VELFWTYANEGDNPELKTFAQQTLPTLEDHLKHARTLEGAS
jgi:putative membrane protein